MLAKQSALVEIVVTIKKMFELNLIIALSIFYIEITLRKGNILHFWRKFLGEKKIHLNIAKPLGLCKYCMAFWLSLCFHFIFSGSIENNIIIYSLCSSGIVSIIFIFEELYFDVTEES